MTALNGIRVLELTTMVSGPYAGMILADLGAETIRIESPHRGEITRHLMTEDVTYNVDGMGPYFVSLNRNKKSITLDLKTEKGLELFYKLVEESDVVLNNFRVGVVERLKIDHAHLIKVNPKIISCSITGFGETGPDRDYPSYDMVAQAMSGVMSMTGQPDGPPTRAGIPIADMGGSMMGVSGILAALVARTTTGKGQHVDISMLDSQISALNYNAAVFGLSKENPGRLGSQHKNHVPYDVYTCKDGYLILAVVTDEFWRILMRILNLPELDTEENQGRSGRLKNREEINSRLNQHFATQSKEHWLEKLIAARIPSAPVNSLSEALAEPQVLARNMWVEITHPNGQQIHVPGNPIKLSGTTSESYSPAPALGQDNHQIFGELLDVSDEDLAAYKSKGII